ncbi:hypothetical protein M3204_03425 [Mesobacillus subterraneus]|uniref:hypothetical protein n=1 Tax=Mesobacillus subterraneus TaxID=285983 RepID=UPI00203DF2D0|nr:hypothetical protein [Mesobacillus subterraneus]MCM3663441.1 hypothetical protein [Mesobacillus subterraneus]MCM3683211.1 hypothetical protein [Mesobacillus subterraneus]
MKIRYIFKDGRYFEQELPNDEKTVSELFGLIVRGKNNNAEIKTDSETLKYEKVNSVELIFS